jgi:hypothetical protein
MTKARVVSEDVFERMFPGIGLPVGVTDGRI